MGCLCEYVILFIMTISYTEETIFKPGYYSMAQIVSECLFVFLTLFINKLFLTKISKYKNPEWYCFITFSIRYSYGRLGSISYLHTSGKCNR